jgi:hypothetical protein
MLIPVSTQPLRLSFNGSLRIDFQAPGAKWARFAVWDTAADGALTEPVRFDNAQ